MNGDQVQVECAALGLHPCGPHPCMQSWSTPPIIRRTHYRRPVPYCIYLRCLPCARLAPWPRAVTCTTCTCACRPTSHDTSQYVDRRHGIPTDCAYDETAIYDGRTHALTTQLKELVDLDNREVFLKLSPRSMQVRLLMRREAETSRREEEEEEATEEAAEDEAEETA